MIPVTKQVDYGLQFLLALRNLPAEACLSVRSFAQERNISFLFMQKIVGSLRKAGLVHSVQGAHGGYQLAVEAKEITLYTVMEAVQGNYKTVACVDEGTCPSKEHCSSKEFFTSVHNDMISLMNNYTLADMPSK